MSATVGRTAIVNGEAQGNINMKGFQLLNLGGTFGLGSVTSVGLTLPAFLTVTGTNPITGSGTFALGLANQNPNTVFGNFTGVSAAPTFGTVSNLIASLGLAPSATIDTTNATNITTGTLPSGVLPSTVVRTNQANTFGAFVQTFQAGVNHILVDPADNTKKIQFNLAGITTNNTRTCNLPDGSSTAVVYATAPASNYLTGISSTGLITYLQPSFSDLQGTLTAAQIPNPTTSAIGGVKAVTAVGHQWVNSIDTTGTPQLSQPAFTDISGTLAIASGGTAATTATGATTNLLPSQTSQAGKFLTTDGAGNLSWATVSGGGSFTSFSIVAANGFYGSVANATTAPALTMFLADPTDTTKKAHFVLSANTTGTDRAITVPDTASTLVVSDTGAANNYISAISASGAITKSQPSASNLSNGVVGSGAVVLASSPTLTTPNIGAAVATGISGLTSAVTPNAAGGTDIGSTALPFGNVYVGGAATNNNKITSATTTAARTFTLPDANSNSVQPISATSHQFLTAISSAGVVSAAQPGFADISGTATAAQGGTGVSNSSTITVGGAISTANSFTTSGNFALTLTQTAATNVTLPTSGTLATLAGTENLTNKTVNKWTFTAPTTAATLTAGADSLTYTLPDISCNVGFREIPVNSQSAAYTAVLNDDGKMLLHPSSDANARTFTIPANSSVAYPSGTVLTFVNQTSQVLSIAITTDTMTLANSTTTGTRSLAQNGIAAATKVDSTHWIISGVGLT